MSGASTALASFSRPVRALVSGASRGIGLAVVRELFVDPAVERVYASSRQGARDARLTALAAGGDRLHALDMDVTSEPSVQGAAEAVQRDGGRLDLLVNCAGVLHEGEGMQPEKRLADVTPESLARSFAVNAVGPLLIAKHFEGQFDRQHRVVFASLSARVGSIGDNRLGGWYAYRASKAAQNMIMQNLSLELRRRARGIICVALHPGTVDTGLSRPFQANVPSERLFPAARAARQLLGVIDGLAPEDNGGFFAWDGQLIPW